MTSLQRGVRFNDISQGLSATPPPQHFLNNSGKDSILTGEAAAPAEKQPVRAYKTPWQAWREWRRSRRASRKFLEAFTPIDLVEPEDFFIVGYPKSGNTWFQDLVSGVVHGVSPTHAPPLLAQT